MRLRADVPLFKVGQRVGLGWHGGHCNYCPPCRRGDFILCENQLVSGINFDGGYADYVIAPANALALMAPELNDVDAAPLLCAGITTFNSLRNSGARPGDTVAILGIGGLGHLAVQYAAKSGYRTVAIARGQDKGPLAKQLGAHIYIDSTTAGSGQGAAEARRRKRDSVHDDQRQGAGVGGRRAGAWRANSLSWARPMGPIVASPFPMLLGRRTVRAGPQAPAWTRKTR